jgi:putative ABC transport system permease protein
MPQPTTRVEAFSTPAKKQTILLCDFCGFAADSFRADKVRATMTALGMVIGTASLILVVTIALTGKQFLLTQIQNVGSNLIWAEYSSQSNAASNAALRDYLTVDDMAAVQRQVPGIQAASPVLNLHDRIAAPGGEERDILVLGVSPEYVKVRRLRVLSGVFFSQQDSQAFNKVALVTEAFAQRQFGSDDLALGQEVKILGLPFTIIGVFRESVDTFGRSEIQDDTILIPYSVARRLTGKNSVNQIYFSMADSTSVPQATPAILKVIQSRHRPESEYQMGDLTQVLSVAQKTADTFTIILGLFATVTLIVGGVGIMNIMFATVSSRIREIGIRKAVGATRRDITLQFLTEAVLISVTGGAVGMLIGLGLPFSVRFFTDYQLPIPVMSGFVAIFACCSVGIAFGTLPAKRAAAMDPVECLKYD